MAELLRDGVAVRADEAVAIAQKLIHEPQRLPPSAPFGPPSIDSVCIGDDGSVICRGCEATPGVAEIAILLQALLPEGSPRVPGSLRYTIARALHDVDAPPFDSLESLSAALARYERGDRDAAVRRLAARASRARVHADAGDERRQGRMTQTARRLLREADEKLYRQQIALDSVTRPPAVATAVSPVRRRVAAAVLALVVVLLILASAAGLRTGASASASPAPLPPPPAWTQPGPREERPAPRAPAVGHASRARTQTPPRVASHPPNRTVSRLFPKFRVVDDFRK